MDLLRDYSVKNVIDKDFEIEFLIPDNCNYTESTDNDIYIIKIDLNSGEIQPSQQFVTCTVFPTAVSGELQVDFEQTFDGITNTRPRIKIVG